MLLVSTIQQNESAVVYIYSLPLELPLPPPPTLLFAAAAAAKWLQSCATLCNPIDGSPPGSPVPGILQARTVEWVAISFSPPGHHKAPS